MFQPYSRRIREAPKCEILPRYSLSVLSHASGARRRSGGVLAPAQEGRGPGRRRRCSAGPCSLAAWPGRRRRAASGHVYDSYYLLQDGSRKVGYRRFRALLLLHYDVTRKRADTAEPPGVRFCLLPRGRLSSLCFLLRRPRTPRSSAYEAAFAPEYRARRLLPPRPRAFFSFYLPRVFGCRHLVTARAIGGDSLAHLFYSRRRFVA